MSTDQDGPIVEQAIETAALKITDVLVLHLPDGFPREEVARRFTLILRALVAKVRGPLMETIRILKPRCEMAEAQTRDSERTRIKALMVAQDVAGPSEDVDALVKRLVADLAAARAEMDMEIARAEAVREPLVKRIGELAFELAAVRTADMRAAEQRAKGADRMAMTRAEFDWMRERIAALEADLAAACTERDETRETHHALIQEIRRGRSREEALREVAEAAIAQLERHGHGYKDTAPSPGYCAPCKVIAIVRAAIASPGTVAPTPEATSAHTETP